MSIRVITAAIGSIGDVLPHLAIGRQLQRRGCDVTILANPAYRQLVGQAGLDCAPIGTAEEIDDTARAFTYHHRFSLGPAIAILQAAAGNDQSCSSL
ncbi:MAG: glycosyltransferase [Phycisphaerae bacterium]